MSSILTNNSAMVALQTLKTINNDLSDTQAMISTGLEVGSAKDNSSIWAISKVMESDVKGFKGISDSLSRGDSTVAIARNGAETITDLLTEVKGKIVAAQEGNDDERVKIQADIDALTSQIDSVVNAAQFNGVNLLSGGEDLSVLSSLDRANDGSVTSANIDVSAQNLTLDEATFGTDASLADPTVAVNTLENDAIEVDVAVAGTFDGAGEGIIKINDQELTFAEGADADETITNLLNAVNDAGIEGITASADGSAGITVSSTVSFGTGSVELLAGTSGATPVGEAEIGERAEVVEFSADAVAEGDSYRVSLGANNFDYVASEGDNAEDIANGLKAAIDAGGLDGISTEVRQNDSGLFELAVDNSGTDDVALASNASAGGTAAGGMNALASIDVSSEEGAAAALAAVEGLIDTSIDAAAAFGSAEGRIETQSEFISNLSDNLTSGIGALVDADMEEASAKLQALQVQQQLGIQSLSIANQAPQSILSLFG